ncbi:NAD-dependent epimerase/dehydratase family protein [Shewanella gelidimarina]|uniref:NAD-dependent epimerase/dehydratase family protein n=1 Tax=Shewanella gelidimarina TaxID=56813 RepID=UPI00200F3146|nr:NAD-dependent epimerase/dehydratase family protein [Shewanella gelidimarina]MCL1057889.1 NAD-dependent epimerase/dehydratase family protein [Shewanella gelidimarina]
MKDKVLVTGSNGFIGKRLVSVLSDGFIVKAVVRQLKSSACIDKAYEIGEISGSTEWKACLDDVNTIVHLAGVAHNNSNVNDYINEVNVKGTINLARQAVNMGVKRFIFISTISVLGIKSKKPFNESSIMFPQSFAAECKCKAENALLKIAENSSLEVVIIRPALVYGIDAPGNVGKLVKLVQKIPFLPFGFCKNKRSFISVDNLIDFIKMCIHHPKAANKIFCISDDFDISIREFTDSIATGLNKKLIQLPVPIILMRLGARLVGKSSIAEQLLGNLQVDSSNVQDTLGWTPPYTMEQVMASLSESKK